MTRWGRDDRQESAHRWSRYFSAAMDASGKNANQIERESRAHPSGVVITRQLVSKWRNGEHAASADSVIVAADILGLDTAEALHTAGHDTVADAVTRRPARGRRHLPPPAAATWSAWVQQAAKNAGYTPERIVAESEGTLTAQNLDDWWGARAVPLPTAVMLVAAMLRADHLEGLRAAGETELADQIHALTLLADPAVRALDRYDLPAEARRRLIREYDRNRARGLEQAAEILHLKAAHAAPEPEDEEHPASGRDAL